MLPAHVPYSHRLGSDGLGMNDGPEMPRTVVSPDQGLRGLNWKSLGQNETVGPPGWSQHFFFFFKVDYILLSYNHLTNIFLIVLSVGG